MSISNQTENQIQEFAKTQSKRFLDRSQMTYWEKLQDKASRTREKVERKANRFKMRSAQSHEAENDLAQYTRDFMEDLMTQGLSEQEAFERAAKELAAENGSDRTADYREYFMETYFDAFSGIGDFSGAVGAGMGVGMGAERGAYPGIPTSPQNAAIGLYYSSGAILGSLLGAVLGVVLGFLLFPEWFWVGAVVGLVAGGAIGVGFAMLAHAHILRKL